MAGEDPPADCFRLGVLLHQTLVSKLLRVRTDAKQNEKQVKNGQKNKRIASKLNISNIANIGSKILADKLTNKQ